MTIKSKLILCTTCLLLLAGLICGFSAFRLYQSYGEIVSTQLGSSVSATIWMTFLATLILLLVLMVLFMIVVSLLLIRSVLTPLSGLSRMAAEIKEGDLDSYTPYAHRDEIGKVYEEFNDMRERLRHSLARQADNDRMRKEMIANIAHDIKTPVTSILGHAEGILDGVANTPEKQAHYLQAIMQKAVVVDKLVTDLYLFSKLDMQQLPFSMEALPVVPLLTSFCEELKLQQANLEITLTMNIPADTQILADSIQLRRVLQNLTENSIKYAGERSRLELTASEGLGRIIFRLTDNGPGVPPEECERIFDRFYRTDPARAGQGSGLGLSISKQITQGMGGKIWARCAEGQGLSVYLSFPLREKEEIK